MRGLEVCEGEVFREEIGGTKVACVEDELAVHSCEKIINELDDANLEHTDEVYIAPTSCLVSAFKGDEMVKYRLEEQNHLGMNRNSQYPEQAPQQALAVTDHPELMDLVTNLEREIVTTVKHENAHLGEVSSEEEAERQARRERMPEKSGQSVALSDSFEAGSFKRVNVIVSGCAVGHISYVVEDGVMFIDMIRLDVPDLRRRGIMTGAVRKLCEREGASEVEPYDWEDMTEEGRKFFEGFEIGQKQSRGVKEKSEVR